MADTLIVVISIVLIVVALLLGLAKLWEVWDEEREIKER